MKLKWPFNSPGVTKAMTPDELEKNFPAQIDEICKRRMGGTKAEESVIPDPDEKPTTDPILPIEEDVIPAKDLPIAAAAADSDTGSPAAAPEKLTMSTTPTPGNDNKVAAQPLPATPLELAAEFPTDPAFCMECLTKNLTLTDSLKAYVRQSREKSAAEASDAAKLAGAGAGIPAIGGGINPTQAPAVRPSPATKGATAAQAPYLAEVDRIAGETFTAAAAAGNAITTLQARAKATDIVNATRPDLRNAYLGR